MPTELAPVLLFVYNRLDVLKQAVPALQANLLAADTDLYIYSDGPKTELDAEKVALVRNYIKGVKGFKKIHIHHLDKNKGLANSIIGGVSDVISEHKKVIVLEDDLITSPNFLTFMNQCLETYRDNKKVFSISGYTQPIKSFPDYKPDVYFFPRNCSHGWATWEDRWVQVDWEMSDYPSFATNKAKKNEFNKGGSDLSGMLARQMEGKLNSWSIRFCYHQFKTHTCTVYPVLSKIQNRGFGKDATHTRNFNRFQTVLDVSGKSSFVLPADVVQDKRFIKEFRKFYSIEARAVGRVKTYLYKLGFLKGA